MGGPAGPGRGPGRLGSNEGALARMQEGALPKRSAVLKFVLYQEVGLTPNTTILSPCLCRAPASDTEPRASAAREGHTNPAGHQVRWKDSTPLRQGEGEEDEGEEAADGEEDELGEAARLELVIDQTLDDQLCVVSGRVSKVEAETRGRTEQDAYR